MDRDSFALGSIPVLTYAHKMPVMQAKAFPSSQLNSGSGLFDDSYSILLSLALPLCAWYKSLILSSYTIYVA